MADAFNRYRDAPLGAYSLPTSTWVRCAACGSPLTAIYVSTWPPSPPTYRCPVTNCVANRTPNDGSGATDA